MPISKRTLTKWRKGALQHINLTAPEASSQGLYLVEELNKAKACILLLTQELLDQALLKEK